MAAILYNVGEQSLINSWLVRGSTGAVGTTQAFAVGLGVSVAIGSQTKSFVIGSNTTTAIGEIGSPDGTPAYAGYARQVINGNNLGSAPFWPASTLATGSYQTVGPQVTFTFTGGPVRNGATQWFVSLAATAGVADNLFGADLAATRTFANGDTEKVTPTFRAT